MNVPTVGISYDPKIDGFLELINMTPVCTYDDIAVDKILSYVDNFMNNEKVDYLDKINYFREIGTKTLNKILDEIK